MAEEEHSTGELWATVKGQGQALTNLAQQVTDGFNKIGETIASSHEKTDRRISQVEQSTTLRFEQVAASASTSTMQRNSQLVAVLGILITAMLGLGGTFTGIVTIGATIYTFTKQPIDQSLANLNDTTKQLASDQKGILDYVDKKLKDYVPKGEVDTNIKIFTDVTGHNTERLDNLEKASAVSITDREAIKRDISRLDDDVHDLRASVKQDFATRKETDVQFADQQARVNSIVAGLNEVRAQFAAGSSINDRFKDVLSQLQGFATELSAFRDNFIVVPSFPKYKQDGMAAPPGPKP